MLSSISPFFLRRSRKTRCVQSATLTIPRRRSHDKVEHVNLEKRRMRCESRASRRHHSRERLASSCRNFSVQVENSAASIFCGGKRARHVIDEIDVTAPVYREMTNGFCGIASLVSSLPIGPHATPKQSPLSNRLSTFVYRRCTAATKTYRHTAAINDLNWKSQINRPMISFLFLLIENVFHRYTGIIPTRNRRDQQIARDCK